MDKSPGKSRAQSRTTGATYFDPDPVLEQSQRDQKSLKPKPKIGPSDDSDIRLQPSLTTRVDLLTHDTSVPPGTKYKPPKTRKQRRADRERRERYVQDLRFCSYDVTQMPSPTKITKVDVKLKAPSAEIKEAKVFPRKPSVSPSDIHPEVPPPAELAERQPKSGTIINVKHPRPKRRKKKPKPSPEPFDTPQGPTIEELIAQELATIQEIEGEEGTKVEPPLENYLTRQFRRKVSQMSKTTSIQSKDWQIEEGEDQVVPQEDRFVNTLVQKFRRESEIKRYERPRRQIKPGTFENFSFTKLRQPTLKTFYYGVKLGTVHQGDFHFTPLSRNKQGICMPIAAYCFSILKHPDKWTQADIDDVLEAGNELFLESADTQHLHGENVELKITDLRKYCKLGKRKVRFVVSEPEISGMIRSDDKKIYNLTKAINIFFSRYSAGILQTENLTIALWKDKHYYFFDASARTIDLFSHPNGVALMANFYDTASIITVLLNRSNLENVPFIIYSINAYKVLLRDAEEVDSTGVIPESDNFQVLDEDKAVALGSFDLADKCFGFSRNKQALTIALVALVYSKISPPSSWHKGTVDKIVIIGNQLFLECIENDSIEEVKIEDLPAVMTIGPYLVEVYIVPNLFVDFLFKKSKCVLLERLEKFFESASNAIIQIDNCALAVWKQRNIYHCFDPYSRNNEGLKCREGTACVSMHTTLDSLIKTISTNFDHKDMIFHIHAMKVCKIHRDPGTRDLFPQCLTMNEYPIENFKKIKMRKGKRKAIKSVTVDHTTRATFLGEIPEESILEVGSNIRSIALEDLPPMVHKVPSRPLPKVTPPDQEFVADLDSPSLSDTQIEPPPPEEPEGEPSIEFVDLDGFDLTQEEKEMVERGEGGEKGKGKKSRRSEAEEIAEEMGGGGEGETAEGAQEWYMAASEFTQIGSQSFVSRMSQEVNTELFPIEVPQEEVPVLVRDIRALTTRRRMDMQAMYEFEMTQEPEVTLAEELAKETNFVNLPDGSQIILGGTNMAAFGSELEFMAPFVCIMASAVAKKYSIDSWSKDVVDYVLKCGSELHQNSNTRYDQNFKLEIPRISLGKTDFSIRVNYIFDTYMKPRVLAMAIHNMLFPQWNSGIVVTPTYSCALFYKNHLYYLYDGFGNNEVGLSKGVSNEGVACLARFINIDSLVARIIHNKAKREQDENIEYNRFVLSSCHVKQLPREEIEEEEIVEEAEGADQDDIVVQSYKKPKKVEEKKPVRMGYHLVEKLYKIEGTKSLGGGGTVSETLKEDYFVCLAACLLLLNLAIKRWDDRKIDMVLDQGINIFNHVEDHDVCSKKFIKNICIDDYIFDIIANRVKFATYSSRRTFRSGIETMVNKKHEHFILQFPDRCYALSVQDKIYHLFDPNDGKASWTRYSNFAKLIKRIRKNLTKGGESYNFHSFEIMTINKAPKSVIVSNRVKKYKIPKGKKPEIVGKPFYEDISWLEVDPIPWSWRFNKGDLPRWNQWWFVDFPDDLYSLFGNLSPLDERFPQEFPKKQTLGNLVAAIGMIHIYDLADWNGNIIDSILIFGDNYFQECIKDIKDENYEVTFEDLKKECSIFPYSFQVRFTPVVEGTLFLVRLKQFNLFKALRAFFDDYIKRFGIICVSKGDNDKRFYAFGKVQDSEYFLYDCETLGPPMYIERDAGVPYILRTTTFNRLLHVMTLTLRGGDFYIFEVALSEFKAIA
ncbi:uncharacterized protein LOC123008655 [Tribolium madens]|uniref:uncharacterized protein LOC123008655 n=1 Tax=Tribolium madens TaxID=41895 RepID=UPI001CF739CC|nr:uncharacterized protein LOC123008655 [Tribolium madens]